MGKETCKICNRDFKRLATHLRTHDISTIDYYKLYDREKYLLELQQEVLNKFYISYRKQYIAMNDKRQIFTMHKTLTDGQVKQHIRQRNRLGIKFGQGSNLIGLDIDTLDIDVLERIYKILIDYGIPDNSMLMSFSGNKGYHVDIFIDDFISRKEVQALYRIILNDAGYKSDIVELRGGSDEGYFLPFAINYKGNNEHWGYCGIVNQFGIMQYDIEKEIDVLEQLQKADTSIIRNIIDVNIDYIDKVEKVDINRAIEEVGKTLEQLELLEIYNTNNSDIIEQIGNRKVIDPHTRHNIAFVYAIALRDAGLGKDDIYAALIDWHSKVEGYTSSWQEVERDCKSICKSVVQKQGQGYRYNLPSNSRPYLTKQDIEQFVSIESIAQRRIYLALAIHSNTFKDGEGNFYMTYKQMNKALGTNINNQSILGHLIDLEQEGQIKIVARDRIEEGQNRHKPNIYKVIRGGAIEEQDIYYLSNNKINRLSIEKAIEKLFTLREFRSLFKNKSNMRDILGCLVA